MELGYNHANKKLNLRSKNVNVKARTDRNSPDQKHKTVNTYKLLGASNHCEGDREINDFYSTSPLAVEYLLRYEKFGKYIYECAAGLGCLSKKLIELGHVVLSSDLLNRNGFGVSGLDFLTFKGTFHGSIISNPPYRYQKQFIEKALSIITEGQKVAMLLRVNSLAGIGNSQLYKKYPIQTVYIFPKRIRCYKEGNVEAYSNASPSIDFSWYVWQKGHQGKTQIVWLDYGMSFSKS